MDTSSIYDDLVNTDLGDKVTKLKEHNEKLLKHIETLEGDVQKLCGELTKMKRNEDVLKRNISELFNTSKLEVERKDRIIAELRKQLDDLLFKRRSAYNGKHFGRPNFNKRGRDEAAAQHYSASKKPKIEPAEDAPREDAEIEQIKTEDIVIKSESGRSPSKSPPRRPTSNTKTSHREGERSYDHTKVSIRNKTQHSKERSQHQAGERDRPLAKVRERSRSKVRHSRERSQHRSRERKRRLSRERSQYHGKERGRGRDRSRERRSRSHSKRREQNYGQNKGGRIDKHIVEDLREFLKNRCKSSDDTAVKGCDVGDKNSNPTIKEELDEESDVNNKRFNPEVKDALDMKLNQCKPLKNCAGNANSEHVSEAENIKIEESIYRDEEKHKTTGIYFEIKKETESETKAKNIIIENKFECSNSDKNVEINGRREKDYIQKKIDLDMSCKFNKDPVTGCEKSQINQTLIKWEANTNPTNIFSSVNIKSGETTNSIRNSLVHPENDRFSETKPETTKGNAAEETNNKSTSSISSKEHTYNNYNTSNSKTDAKKQDLSSKASARSRRRCVIKLVN